MYMSKEQLQHLAHLAKLELTADEEEKYLKDLEAIIGFLETLKVNSQGENPITNTKLKPFTELESYQDPKGLLKNTKHPIEQNCISIQTSLKTT